MGRPKLTPYTCPRCGYKTHRKDHFHKHLYLNKKQCPTIEADIELTDEIKEHLMNYRKYHDRHSEKVINNTINNYNTMNNYIANLDTFDKLGKVMKHKSIELIPFDRSVELKYEKTRMKLENDQGHHAITHEDIYEIIDHVTRVSEKNMDDFNILYDSEMNKIMMYESGDWKEMFMATGLKTVIRTIQDYFWHAYECYLIRKMQRTTINAFDRVKLRELLKEYYAFIASLDVEPFVKDKCNNKIMYTADDDEYWDEAPPSNAEQFTLSEEYTKLYNDLRGDLTIKLREKWKHDLLDLVKRNCKKNVNELNKMVMALINMDTEFKTDLLVIA